MDDWLPLTIVAFVLMVVGGMVSAAGNTLSSAKRSKLKQLEEQGSISARMVLSFQDNPVRLIASVQLSVLLLWVSAAVCLFVGPTYSLAGLLRRFPEPLISQNPLIISLLLVLSVFVLLCMILGELVPRAYAAHFSDRLALISVRPMRLLIALVWPLTSLVIASSNLLLKPIGGSARLGMQTLTEEDFKGLVEAGEEEGVIEEDEGEMISSIFEFSDTVVRQVMVPRIDMNVINVDSTIDELLDLLMECGHSRIPVYEENVDSIIGIIHAKDLLPVLKANGNGHPSIKDLMRPAFFVPENKNVSELLAEFKNRKQQLAIVRDEYGGTAGLVTVEDLIEEIVGEITDEYDKEEEPAAIPDGEGTIVDARMSIDDINEQFDMDLPTDEFETVGGFVFGMLGKEPVVGDHIVHNGWTFTVEAKEDHRLKKIRLSEINAEEEPESAATPGDKPQSASG